MGKKLDLAFADHWFCFECGISGTGELRCRDHRIGKFRSLLNPDVFLGPLYFYVGNKFVAWEQAVQDPDYTMTGCQYIINFPKHWFVLKRFIVDNTSHFVYNRDHKIVGYASDYNDQILAGQDYVP